MKHLPNNKQEYQIARLVVEIASNPEKYKEVVVYSLTEDGAKKNQAVASKFIISNDWLSEEDEVSITIWTGCRIKFLGLGGENKSLVKDVKYEYDVVSLDEWFTA